MSYFLIQNTDGDVNVHEYTVEEVNEWLEAGGVEELPEFMERIPDLDTNYWEGRVLLIKGQVVVPRPIQVVTKLRVS